VKKWESLLNKLVTPCASVAKQCNLVLVTGRWCFQTIGGDNYRSRVTWPCATDFVVYTTYRLGGLWQGDDHLAFGSVYWGSPEGATSFPGRGLYDYDQI